MEPRSAWHIGVLFLLNILKQKPLRVLVLSWVQVSLLHGGQPLYTQSDANTRVAHVGQSSGGIVLPPSHTSMPLEVLGMERTQCLLAGEFTEKDLGDNSLG